MRHLSLFACALIASFSVPALHAQQGDPPSRVARISALVGQASLQPSVASQWSEAALNYTITTGDRIFTAQGARLELEVGPMSVRLWESADVTVTNLSDDFMQLGIAQGTMRLSVYRLLRGDSIEVDTPNGAIIVTTPGDYRIDVPEDDRFTIVSVDAGRVEIIGPGIDQEVRSGQAVQLTGTDDIRAVSIPRPRQTSFDQWGAERNRRIHASACSRYMNQDIPGCADLDESGRWERNAEYGDVWYPTRVSAGWVPYRDGRWVWIDPWGWSWVADEPWGYAPFHYGRWARFGPTWGWIPGPVAMRPYYAPALVAFIGGSGWSIGVTIGSQAWFPLGPREAYFPSYHYGDAYLRQINITNIRNVTNINTIINVRNVEQVNYVNRAAGITAVPTDVFRNGQPISRAVLRVKPEDNMRGSVVTHPAVAPVERAALGGRPAAKPRVADRPIMITRGVQRGDPQRGIPQRGIPQRGGVQPPTNPPTVVRTPPPTVAAPPIPPATRTDTKGVDRSKDRRTIITRTPPPPAKPPFTVVEPTLKAQPGKPLEPQQVQNVRAGKPPGPPKDAVVNPPPSKPPVASPPPAKPPEKKPPVAKPPAKDKGRGGKPDSTGRGGKPPETSNVHRSV